jgi:LPXTG-site transpeptidase (sortase) family protein
MNLALQLAGRVLSLYCLVVIFLTSCSSPAANPRVLPPPAVSVARSASPVSNPITPDSSPAPTAVSSRVPRLLELAARAYGARLILEVDIPTIDVSSPVVAVGWVAKETAQGGSEIEWDSPESLAGWVVTSALPGEGSNIILYGHNNLYTSIFRDLGSLKVGDGISLKTGERTWSYRVSQVLFLKSTFASAETLKSYEQYLQPALKEQLTIISCWPPVSNTHRVIVVAEPAK